MNSLEDRVRAAVQATAAEIAPDDVPPMRPLGAGSGGSRRRTGRGSGGARGAAWRWGAPLAAAAAVLAVVAAASLLAGVLPSHARVPPLPGRRSPPTARTRRRVTRRTSRPASSGSSCPPAARSSRPARCSWANTRRWKRRSAPPAWRVTVTWSRSPRPLRSRGRCGTLRSSPTSARSPGPARCRVTRWGPGPGKARPTSRPPSTATRSPGCLSRRCAAPAPVSRIPGCRS